MSVLVQCEVVGASELLDAEVALEGSFASVFAFVSGQLVGSGESRITARNVAQIRLLAGVDSFVSLQVAAFGVDFVATWIFAVVNSALLQLRIVVTTPLEVTAGVGR